MSPLPDFLVKILRESPRHEEGRGKMIIIIRRPYAYLEAELHAAFRGQEEVQVIVDRRMREQLVELERRQGKPRRPKEEILEVVISD